MSQTPAGVKHLFFVQKGIQAFYYTMVKNKKNYSFALFIYIFLLKYTRYLLSSVRDKSCYAK